jgi:hypothetical protein
MNFIKDRELALRFKNNAVSSKERFLYLLIFMTLTTLLSSSFFIADLYSTKLNQWDIYTDIVMLVLTIAGTIICYQTNKRGDDKEFIERYISIGFPVGIRSLLFLILIGGIFLVIAVLTAQGEISDESTVYDLLVMTAFILYFYWRLNSSIKLASN